MQARQNELRHVRSVERLSRGGQIRSEWLNGGLFIGGGGKERNEAMKRNLQGEAREWEDSVQ